jgi:uncharacterized protein YabN with tetrapyrrole methylase and pyrophosphatase domain
VVDTQSASVPPALVLAGFGAPNSLHLTLEAQQAVIQAGRALALGLPPRLAASLKRQGVEITALDPVLEERPPAEAYATIAAAVLSRAKHDPPAIFISQGNPLFLNTINRYLVVESGARELGVRIIPGVSSIDLVVNDLGLDVGRSGLLSIAAAGLVRTPALLNAKVPLLVLQLGGVDATGHDQLLAALSWKYPPDHATTLINLPVEGGVTRATVTLERFADLVPHIDNSSMLFLDLAPVLVPAPSPTLSQAAPA